MIKVARVLCLLVYTRSTSRPNNLQERGEQTAAINLASSDYNIMIKYLHTNITTQVNVLLAGCV